MIVPGAPRPSAVVLRAFGAGERRPLLLPGGQGTTWRAGGIVLRPHGDAREARWRSATLARLAHSDRFRAPRPVASADGSWLVDGWEAWEWLPGATDPSRVDEVLAAGDAFHRAVAHLPRPAFLDLVDDPWSRADRMVWAGTPRPSGPLLDRLAAAFRPVRASSQVVHRDLLGNVLFAAGEPPTVFDWAPSWRPAGYASAIAVVDAVCWHGVPVERLPALGQLAGVSDWPQLLVRALAFRVLVLHVLGVWDDDHAERHRPLATALLSGAAGTLDA